VSFRAAPAITGQAMERRDRFDGRFDAVLAAARRGDARALDELFASLAPIVAGYLRLQGGAEPDDLTSDVFLGAFRNLGTFQGDEAAFRSWLFTIAHRRLLDERRRRRRRPPPEPLDGTAGHVAPDDVEATVAAAASEARVRALCDDLAPDQRDVLLLRLLGGLTVDEVATTLGKSSGAVKALQRRGYASIARRLEREGVPL
jgi:RNA polymerase sigma-70 factor (ECF subfamily)